MSEDLFSLYRSHFATCLIHSTKFDYSDNSCDVSGCTISMIVRRRVQLLPLALNSRFILIHFSAQFNVQKEKYTRGKPRLYNLLEIR